VIIIATGLPNAVWLWRRWNCAVESDATEGVAGAGSAAPAPLLLSRGSSVISVRSRCDASATAGGGYHVMYGKEFGSGTAVALTSTRLPGLGVRLGVHVDDPYASVPGLPTLRPSAGETIVSSDASEAPLPATALVAHVSGLVPNESYVFASAAYRSDGTAVGPVSATSTAVNASSPLPLTLLWGHLATTAARLGELSLSRRAAAASVVKWLSQGPLRPPSAAAPTACLSLRRLEVSRTPPPLLDCLARALCILGSTEQGGAVDPPPSTTALCGDPRGDAGLSHAHVDERVEGREWEGPWSGADKAALAALAAPVHAQMAALRRVATMAMAVEVASVLRCVPPSCTCVRARPRVVCRCCGVDVPLSHVVPVVTCRCSAMLCARDPHLIMHTVCGCYAATQPLLAYPRLRPSALLQPLATCHQAMQLLPPASWHQPAVRCYAKIVYELVCIAANRERCALASAARNDTAVVTTLLEQLGIGSAPKPRVVEGFIVKADGAGGLSYALLCCFCRCLVPR
jgi:hypothetical protein